MLLDLVRGERWIVFMQVVERAGYLRELKITGSRNKPVHQTRKEKGHVFSYSKDLDEKSHEVF